MIITTTQSIEGKKIMKYLGIVTGEAILGANIFRDMFAAVRDIVGGSGGRVYQLTLDMLGLNTLERSRV